MTAGPTLAHRLEAAGVRVLEGLARVLPRAAAFALGRAMGTAARHAGVRVGVARANLAAALPERSASEREAILAAAYTHAGMSAIELLRADLRDMAGRVRIEGLDHLASARRGGRGLIVVSGHFGAVRPGRRGRGRGGPPGAHVRAGAEQSRASTRVVAWRKRLSAGVLGHGRAAWARRWRSCAAAGASPSSPTRMRAATACS